MWCARASFFFIMTDNDTDFKIGAGTDITIPLRNLLSIIGAVAIAVIGYFNIDERIMMLEHEQEKMQLDLDSNTEFRIKWPRGELGSLPADAEQNMRLDFIEKYLEKLEKEKGTE